MPFFSTFALSYAILNSGDIMKKFFKKFWPLVILAILFTGFIIFAIIRDKQIAKSDEFKKKAYGFADIVYDNEGFFNGYMAVPNDETNEIGINMFLRTDQEGFIESMQEYVKKGIKEYPDLKNTKIDISVSIMDFKNEDGKRCVYDFSFKGSEMKEGKYNC